MSDKVTGYQGGAWIPTKEDPLCVTCNMPKHSHMGGDGACTEDPTCTKFVWPSAAVLSTLVDPTDKKALAAATLAGPTYMNAAPVAAPVAPAVVPAPPVA